MEAILSLDIGTTSMRGVLFSPSGEMITISQRHTCPSFLEQGRVEQDPLIWKEALTEILTEIAGRPEIHILGIGVTAFRSPVFPVSEDGIPLASAIMWQDKRTDALCEELLHHDDTVFRKSGLKITSVFSGVKMLWFRRNRPELHAQAHKYIGVQDYIIYLLTGRYVTDHSLASRTNLFNLETLDWDEELLSVFEVDREHLCDLVAPGSICGTLGEPYLGILNSSVSIPVISAGGDQQCAALGLGLIAPGNIVVNTGTGSYVIACSDHPVIDEDKRLFCNVGAIPGRYIIEAGTLASGTIYRWLSEELYEALPEGEPVFRRIDREIMDSVPGSHGVVCLPHPTGRGAPYWDPGAKGVFFGLSLATKRGDIARSILEGIVVETAENIDLIDELGIPAETVSVAGGMTRFDLYNQMQADGFSMPVTRYDNLEATAVGAWMSTAVTIGLYGSYEAAFSRYAGHTKSRTYQPGPEGVKVFRELKEKKKRLYDAIKGL